MRLIDADLLYDRVEARYRQSSGEEHRTERALLDAICDSPTIDAITVEWLRKYQSRMTNMSRAMGIDILLEMWQKEQEARWWLSFRKLAEG